MKKIIAILLLSALSLMAAPQGEMMQGACAKTADGKICPSKANLQCTGKNDCQCPQCAKAKCTGQSDCPHCAEMKCTGKSDCACPKCAQKVETSCPHCKQQ